MEDTKKNAKNQPQTTTHQMPSRFVRDPEPSHTGRPTDGSDESEPGSSDQSGKPVPGRGNP